ncbi:MAG: hypothetical protein A2163_07440 [Actinobacteria bacterium RBG_13_35_12]|jgi:competence protein ComGC|nr:MAG: hypothetical protein A2163_07440 [Actinobacteria bacterium RBG_13_35_12]
MKLLLNKKIKDSGGFTLVEILLVVMLIFIVVSMVSATYILSANTSRDVIEITTSGIDSKTAIYRISKDLREAKNISVAYNDSIIFNSNVYIEEDSFEVFEEVNYYLVSKDGYYNLYRKVDEEDARVVATNIVNNDLFSYYTGINIPENGMETPVSEAELESIKIIEIKLSIDQGGTESNRTMELKTSIYLRNKS